jgi:phospholipid/cholesterol/gamma-HCH transport system ATP-binding protein
VEVKGVDKSFGDLTVFRNLDLSVRRGETITVLGPSGAGKSVLLKLLIGLYKPDAGRILVDGVDVVPLGEGQLHAVRRKVGMLFQGAALFDSMTVGENIAYGLHEHFDWPPKRVAERVAECLEWVGLPGIESMRPADLSGGMKKRVGLARAIAPGPDVILYDEPTTGLDPSNTHRINELIVSLRQRLTVTSIVITHDIESALAVSDRVALVKARRIGVLVDVETARSWPPPELQAFVRGEEVD